MSVKKEISVERSMGLTFALRSQILYMMGGGGERPNPGHINGRHYLGDDTVIELDRSGSFSGGVTLGG